MATETKNNVPPPAEKEKELKDDASGDNKEQKTEETAEPTEKGDESAAKPEPAPPKPVVHKANYEKDVVYLFQFSRTPIIPSVSPYCLKVETWLRLAGVKYENVDHKCKYRSKKGKLPFVELNGEEITDSALIIKELAQKFEKDLDSGLTSEQQTISHAMTSMIENHLLWIVYWWRAKYPDSLIKGYKVNLQNALGSRVPNSILNYCFKFTYSRKGIKKVKAHGIGVHSQEEIIEFGTSDLKALSQLLADKPFFFGDEPTCLDVVAFANLAQFHFIDAEVSHPLRDIMSEQFGNLVGLVTRVKERCFPDWDEICTKLDLNAHLPKPVKETKEGKDGAEKQAPAADDKEPEKEKAEEKEKEAEKEKEEKKESAEKK